MPHRPSLPGAMLVATAVLILLDWAFIRGGSGEAGGVRLHMAYVAGHRLFLALVCIGPGVVFARLGQRLPRWAGPLVAAGVAVPVLFLLLREDLRSFGPVMRLVIALVFATGPLVLTAVALWEPRPRWVRVGCVGVAVAAGLANHWVLAQHFPGFHVACIVLGQLAGGVGLAGVARSFSGPRWLWVLRDVVVVAIAGWSVVVPPSSRVAVRLATDDAAPLYRFVAEFYAEGEIGEVDAGNEYFRPRRDAPAVPAGPALVDRDGLRVVVVSIDALRYDVAMGERGGRFAALTELRDTGILFKNAYAPAITTTATFAALFMGRYVSQIQWERVQVNERFDQLPVASDGPRFPGLLTEAGVATYLVPTHWRVAPRGRVAGGFAEVAAGEERPASEALPLLLKWLEEPRAGAAFVFCHLVDAHYPYDSSGVYGESFERYVRELESVDRELMKLLNGLKRSAAWDRTIVVVMADHGEAFGEHGQVTHGGWAYEELLRVPLIVRVPGVAARTIDEVVSLGDLGPTLLDLFGVETPGVFMGQSLVPLLRGEAPRFARPVAFATARGQFGFVFADRIKALYSQGDRRAEVYDLKVDPGEETNLADEAWAQARMATVRAFFRAHTGP